LKKNLLKKKKTNSKVKIFNSFNEALQQIRKEIENYKNGRNLLQLTAEFTN